MKIFDSKIIQVILFVFIMSMFGLGMYKHRMDMMNKYESECECSERYTSE